MVATEKQLNINDILNVDDLKQKRVDVPEWGGYVVIKTMSAEARDAYEMSLFKRDSDGDYKQNLENGRAKLVAACCIAPNGQRMFKSEDHVIALGQKSAAAVNRIFEECQKLNAVTDQDIDELLGN